MNRKFQRLISPNFLILSSIFIGSISLVVWAVLHLTRLRLGQLLSQGEVVAIIIVAVPTAITWFIDYNYKQQERQKEKFETTLSIRDQLLVMKEEIDSKLEELSIEYKDNDIYNPKVQAILYRINEFLIIFSSSRQVREKGMNIVSLNVAETIRKLIILHKKIIEADNYIFIDNPLNRHMGLTLRNLSETLASYKDELTNIDKNFEDIIQDPYFLFDDGDYLLFDNLDFETLYGYYKNSRHSIADGDELGVFKQPSSLFVNYDFESDPSRLEYLINNYLQEDIIYYFKNCEFTELDYEMIKARDNLYILPEDDISEEEVLESIFNQVDYDPKHTRLEESSQKSIEKVKFDELKAADNFKLIDTREDVIEFVYDKAYKFYSANNMTEVKEAVWSLVGNGLENKSITYSKDYDQLRNLYEGDPSQVLFSGWYTLDEDKLDLEEYVFIIKTDTMKASENLHYVYIVSGDEIRENVSAKTVDNSSNYNFYFTGIKKG